MSGNPAAQLDAEFGSFPGLIAAWGEYRGDAPALYDGQETLSWREVADKVERIAARLQADGLQRGQAVAILGTTCNAYALVYLAAIRAGGCAAPLTTSASPDQLRGMAADKHLVFNEQVLEHYLKLWCQLLAGHLRAKGDVSTPPPRPEFWDMTFAG